VINVDKTGSEGNVFIEIDQAPVDLNDWREAGVLTFDYKINSAEPGVELLPKLDSGWPDVSDVSIPVTPLGEWQSYSIGLEELRLRGNSLGEGMADLSLITNLVVFEPQGAMSLSIDNLRFEIAP